MATKFSVFLIRAEMRCLTAAHRASAAPWRLAPRFGRLHRSLDRHRGIGFSMRTPSAFWLSWSPRLSPRHRSIGGWAGDDRRAHPFHLVAALHTDSPCGWSGTLFSLLASRSVSAFRARPRFVTASLTEKRPRVSSRFRFVAELALLRRRGRLAASLLRSHAWLLSGDMPRRVGAASRVRAAVLARQMLVRLLPPASHERRLARRGGCLHGSVRGPQGRRNSSEPGVVFRAS